VTNKLKTLKHKNRCSNYGTSQFRESQSWGSQL